MSESKRQGVIYENGGVIMPDKLGPLVIPKRGKDIKCFDDLPVDVQRTIRAVSESNEEFQRRVGIAIHYQHVFPDRYHSTGVTGSCCMDHKHNFTGQV